jgi:DNA-directed RNA polymerase specialized sigma24 family protein
VGIGPTGAVKAVATPYEQHRDYVLAVLSRRCGWLDRDEREEAFHEAYAVVLEKERDGLLAPDAMPAHQLRAFLTQTAIHKGLDEGKRVGRKRSVPLGDAELTEPDVGRAPEDLAAAGMDSARVREIVGELPARGQAIVKLRFFFDRTPDEIQRCLSISERVYRRELERALRHVFERYELVRAGSFCESRKSVILAFVIGIAGPSRARAAQEHLATCPSCAHWAAELREATRQAAAVVPMPAIALPHGPGERFLHAAGVVRDQLVDAGTGAKHHLIAAATKVDPASAGYASAARPGTVAIVVAGCVAVGSGATYCATEGVTAPLRGIAKVVGVNKARDHKEKRASRPKRASAAQAPEARVVSPPTTTTPVDTQPAPPPPEPEPVAPEPAQPPPEPVEEEFGLEEPSPQAPVGGSGGGDFSGPAGGGSAGAAPASPAPGGAQSEFGP